MARSSPDQGGQDGGDQPCAAKADYKAAAMKLFAKTASKDPPQPTLPQAGTEDLHNEADDTIPLEDPATPLLPWDSVSTQACVSDALSALYPDHDSPEPTLRDIMAAVLSCNTSIAALMSETKGVKAELFFVRQDMQKLRDRTTALEGRLSTLEDDWAPIQREVHYNSIAVDKEAAHIDDMENRMRRNNVRAISIPEKTEGKNPVQFTEPWLLQIYGKDSFSPMFCVERAHRLPMRPLPSGNPPHTFLFKLLNYKDRDIILSKARNLVDTLKMANSKISLFPDFSAKVQKQRA